MIKSIFARPVFINPQAYLVIPQLANLSMLEPIDFTSTNTYSFESLGKVESKIISAKDEYILHIDLYESYGSCVLGEFYIGPATIGSIDDFTITTNGYITTIEVGGGDSGNIVYPGLIAAWSAKGKTNDDEDRAILKDLTGNGHDITLNGFAFSEMSGYGSYNFTFKSLTEYTSSLTYIERNNTEDSGVTRYLLSFSSNGRYKSNPSFKIKVIINSDYNINLKYIYYQDGIKKEYSINESGIYECPASEPDPNTTAYSPFISYSAKPAYIYVELLPEYPDALVFDGVDDYGINENMPILTDYTVIYDREIIDIPISDSMFITDGGDYAFGNAFGIEKYYADRYYTTSMRHQIEITNIIKKNRSINYQTLNKYNGVTIGDITDTSLGKKEIFLFKNRNSYSKGAFYSAYLFDRSLDEQEIKEFIRKYIDPEYLLPSEQASTPVIRRSR